MDLSTLQNTHRPKKRRKLVGRGIGCKRGKTCTRGHKGAKSRAGYKRRAGTEGGQLPLYRKLPTRGFSNNSFKTEIYALNLGQIDEWFEEGEVVSLETLKAKRIIGSSLKAKLKILSLGQLTKKVAIHAHSFSKQALIALENQSVELKKL